MKKLYHLIFLILLGSSCNTAKHYAVNVTPGHDASEENKGNFYRTNKGREVKLSDDLEIKSGGELDLGNIRKMKIDNRKINVNDVQAIQIDGDYYERTYRNVFARRIYKGPLNVYKHTQITTTTNSRGSSRTNYTDYYFVQKKNVQKNELYMVRGTGRQEGLRPYLQDYKPSIDILNEYQKQRKISRIVKFSTLGLWLASIPVTAIGVNRDNTALTFIGGTAFLLGPVYTPIVAFTFKSKNHRRPFQAVQTYIDNNLGQESLLAPPKESLANSITDSSSVVAENTASSVTVPVNDPNFETVQGDFIQLNHKDIIVANPGTKLRSANNKIFSINDHKYTSGITAFRINKKFYKTFPEIEKDSAFAQRTITGKMNVYNVVKGSQKASSTLSENHVFVKDAKSDEFFENTATGAHLRGRNHLSPLFQDNAQSLSMYKSYLQHYRATKTTGWTLSAVTMAGVVGAIVFAVNGNSTTATVLGVASTGIGLYNLNFLTKKIKNLNKEFIEVIGVYNGDKKVRNRAKRKV